MNPARTKRQLVEKVVTAAQHRPAPPSTAPVVTMPHKPTLEDPAPAPVIPVADAPAPPVHTGTVGRPAPERGAEVPAETMPPTKPLTPVVITQPVLIAPPPQTVAVLPASEAPPPNAGVKVGAVVNERPADVVAAVGEIAPKPTAELQPTGTPHTITSPTTASAIRSHAELPAARQERRPAAAAIGGRVALVIVAGVLAAVIVAALLFATPVRHHE